VPLLRGPELDALLLALFLVCQGSRNVRYLDVLRGLDAPVTYRVAVYRIELPRDAAGYSELSSFCERDLSSYSEAEWQEALGIFGSVLPRAEPRSLYEPSLDGIGDYTLHDLRFASDGDTTIQEPSNSDDPYPGFLSTPFCHFSYDRLNHQMSIDSDGVHFLLYSPATLFSPVPVGVAASMSPAWSVKEIALRSNYQMVTLSPESDAYSIHCLIDTRSQLPIVGRLNYNGATKLGLFSYSATRDSDSSVWLSASMQLTITADHAEAVFARLDAVSFCVASQDLRLQVCDDDTVSLVDFRQRPAFVLSRRSVAQLTASSTPLASVAQHLAITHLAHAGPQRGGGN